MTDETLGGLEPLYPTEEAVEAAPEVAEEEPSALTEAAPAGDPPLVDRIGAWLSSPEARIGTRMGRNARGRAIGLLREAHDALGG